MVWKAKACFGLHPHLIVGTETMTDLDIIQQRLSNQHLAGNPLEKPEEVVA